MSGNKGLQWVRSFDVVPYPNVWEEFEAKESRDSDKLVKYRIQDLPVDRFDDALKHLIENYMVDEPVSVACDGFNNKDYVDDYLRLWRGALQQKLTTVCFREDSDEIIAINVLIISTKNDTYKKEIKQQSKSKNFVDFLKAFDIMYKNFSPYEKYGVDSFMASYALSVDRRYRGLAIGTRMLKARAKVAAPFGFKLTHSTFSSDYSNANADNAGFHLDIAYTYDELMKIDPDLQFQNVQSKGLTAKTLIF